MSVHDRGRICLIDLGEFFSKIHCITDRYDYDYGERYKLYKSVSENVARSVLDRSALPVHCAVGNLISKRDMFLDVMEAAFSLEEMIRDWFFRGGVGEHVNVVSIKSDKDYLTIEFESVYTDTTILFEDYINGLLRDGEPVHAEVTKAIRHFRSIHPRGRLPKLFTEC